MDMKTLRRWAQAWMEYRLLLALAVIGAIGYDQHNHTLIVTFWWMFGVALGVDGLFWIATFVVLKKDLAATKGWTRSNPSRVKAAVHVRGHRKSARSTTGRPLHPSVRVGLSRRPCSTATTTNARGSRT